MTDVPETSDDPATSAGDAASDRSRGPGRYGQRSFAERLFPGPSREMSARAAKRIDGLLAPLDEEARAKLRAEWRARAQTGSQPALPTSVAPITPSAPVVTAENLAEVRDTLEQQNELLRAILASSVDTQTDARSTAQNSRTFAWAGTAIALLTLVATVIAVVAAVRG